MADIELVIKIDEERYSYVKEQVEKGIDNPLKVIIANGIPLPKGHGRLIDADVLEECKELMTTIIGWKFAVRMDDIRNIPTIIEADKEV